MHCFRHRQRDVGGVACVIFSHRFVLSLTRRVCCCNINDFITNMAHSPPPKLWYLPNHRDALQAHMHLLHKLGNAKTEVNYHAYYQTLIKDGTANGATSDAYLTSSDVLFKTKCIIMKYKTGTLYNQKRAVLFKLSTSQTCPLCP